MARIEFLLFLIPLICWLYTELSKLFYSIVLCISCQEECFQVVICSHVWNAYEVTGAKHIHGQLQELNVQYF